MDNQGNGEMGSFSWEKTGLQTINSPIPLCAGRNEQARSQGGGELDDQMDLNCRSLAAGYPWATALGRARAIG